MRLVEQRDPEVSVYAACQGVEREPRVAVPVVATTDAAEFAGHPRACTKPAAS